tara:strand:- start:296 stop:622 length:327 start_codon:yes stop_codon:yes gene_type:complete
VASINNIIIDQGTTFTLSVILTNDDNTPKDLTNYTIASQIRKSYYTNTFTAFTTSKVDLTGEISISLSAAETSALKAGRYVYDIEIEDPSETVRVIEGIVTVTPEVTR